MLSKQGTNLAFVYLNDVYPPVGDAKLNQEETTGEKCQPSATLR